MAKQRQYRGFISYSHAADQQLAERLQYALQQFAKPFYARRAFDIFRDQTDLGANPALWPRIADALDHSEYFLLLASPRAAQSKWVKREIDHWLARHGGRPERLLILWTDGNLAWGDGDFDWGATDALPHTLDWDPNNPAPRQLAGTFGEVPLYIDLRWTRAQKDLSERDPKFLDDVATIAAELHQTRKRDLIGRDVTEHARLKRIGAAAILALIALAITAAVFGVIARNQERIARTQAGIARDRQAEAERAAAVALSRQLAAQSAEDGERQYDLGLLLAVAADQVADTDQARAALFESLQRASYVSRFVASTGTLLNGVAFAPGGSHIVAGDTEGMLRLYDTSTAKETRPPIRAHDGGIDSIVSCGQRSLLFSTASDGRIRQWRLPDLVHAGDLGVPWHGHIGSLAVSPDCRWLAAASGGVRIADLSNGEWSDPVVPPRTDDSVTSLAFHPAGRVFAATYQRGDVELWDREMRTLLRRMRGHDTPYVEQTVPGTSTDRTDASVNAAAFSPDGATLATGGYDGRVVFWDWQSGTNIGSTSKMRGFVTTVTFSPDGTLFAATSGGVVRGFDTSGDAVTPAIAADTGHISGAAASAGPRLATVGWDGRVLLWDFRQWAVGRHFAMPEDEPAIGNIQQTMVRDVVASDERLAVTTSARHPLRLWDLENAARSRDLAVDAQPRSFAVHGTRVFFVDSMQRLMSLDLTNAAARPALVTNFGLQERIGHLRLNTGGTRVIAVTLRGTILDVALTGGPIARRAVPVVGGAGTVILSRDAGILASASDSEVAVTDVATGKELFRHAVEPTSIALAPHGGLLAVNRYQFTDMFDVRQRRLVRTINHVARATSHDLAFSPDGSTLVAVGGATTFWDVRSGVQLLELRHPANASGIARTFTADGKRYVEGHHDGSISVWDVDRSSWRRTACTIANRGFTMDELSRYGDIGAMRQTCSRVR